MALIYLLVVAAVLGLSILRFLCRPRPVKIPIKDRHVFITGGSSGIGLALAHRAASAGSRVSILARSVSKLEEAKEDIRNATGVEVAVYSADVRNMEAVRSAIEAAGPIDVLICNQGVYISGELVDVDMNDIKFMLDVNVVGTFHLIKAALPKMKEGSGGSDLRSAIEAAVRSAIEAAGPIDVLICNQGVYISGELVDVDMNDIKFMLDVNVVGTFHLIKAALPKMKEGSGGSDLPKSIGIISSQAGQIGIYGYAAYSASKFALRGLAEALQQEVISDNIHVSLITPPYTETPGIVEEKKRRPKITNKLAQYSPVMKAEDVAEKALNGIESGDFIVSCSFIGHILSISTAGLSPQRSYIMAFIKLVDISFIRFVGLCYLWICYGIVAKYQSKHLKNSTSTKVAPKKNA